MKTNTFSFDCNIPAAGGEMALSRVVQCRSVPMHLVSDTRDGVFLVYAQGGCEILAYEQSIWAVPSFEPQEAIRSNIPDFPPVICEVGMEISLRVRNLSSEPKHFSAIMVARRIDPFEPIEGWLEACELVPGDTVERRIKNWRAGHFDSYGIVASIEGPWAHVRFPNEEKAEVIDRRALRKVEPARVLPCVEDMVRTELDDVPETFTKWQWKEHLLALQEVSENRPALLHDLINIARKNPWLLDRGVRK